MILDGRRNLTEVLERIIAPAFATGLRIEEGRERIHDFVFFFRVKRKLKAEDRESMKIPQKRETSVYLYR